jgi:GNAT superfamily N-acetyltransferase
MQSIPEVDLVVTDGTISEAAEFMAREWPRHDVEVGIRWSSLDLVLGGKLAEETVGVAQGVVIGGVGELKQILVKKDLGRRGLGSRLLAEFEARCRSLHCHKLRLETADYQARPFYERHGFEVVVTLTNDRFNRDWFVMEKRL